MKISITNEEGLYQEGKFLFMANEHEAVVEMEDSMKTVQNVPWIKIGLRTWMDNEEIALMKKVLLRKRFYQQSFISGVTFMPEEKEFAQLKFFEKLLSELSYLEDKIKSITPYRLG